MSQTTPPRSMTPAEAIEAEVRDNVLAQKSGERTLGDFGLPAEFVSRLADRAIRASFYERYRAVVDPSRVGHAHEPARSVGIDGIDPGTQGGDARLRETPRRSLEGFHAFSDSGADAPAHVRAHLTRSTHYLGAGDGGNLDLVRGAMSGLAECGVTLHAGTEHAAEVEALLGGAAGNPRVRVVAQPERPSQWAGDNAKCGSIVREGGHDGVRVAAHLVPRFASRREAPTLLARADDEAISRTSSLGFSSARSPLLFQGGNLLVCDDEARRERVLLLGEAEVWRNLAPGIDAARVTEWFRVEMGVDRCVVLPAASYHIDQEVTVRTRRGQAPVAFVADGGAGTRLILDAALSAIESSGRWSDGSARAALGLLRAGRFRELLTIVWNAFQRELSAEGAWTVEFAQVMSKEPGDSGVGNLQRFLLALDLLTGEVASPGELPNPHQQAVLRSFQRRQQDRRRMRVQLETLGWRVVLIPGVPEDDRGINPLNGIQLPDRYLMPTYGGVYRAFDDAARGVFERELGPGVRVVGVPSAESQRREGSLHCSLGIYGAVPGPHEVQ